MRRLLVQLDENMYSRLKARSIQEKRSMSEIVRESLEQTNPHRQLTMKDFTFVGSGRSKPPVPAGKDLDDAYADAIESRWRRKK